MTPDPAQESHQVRGNIPSRARAGIALDIGACTACDLCAVECPVWCIELTSHTETRADGPGRPRKEKVLDEFVIDFGVCMYCGICIQVCPFDALAWVPIPPGPVRTAPNSAAAAGLSVRRDELGSWWPQTPPGAG